MCERVWTTLLGSCGSDAESASFLAAREPLARGWLTCLPISQVGTVVGNATFRIGICLRFGLPPYEVDKCARCCKYMTGPTHGLHCRRSAGRFSRHAALNDVVCRALGTAQIPARREPTGLYTTQTRPDGLTLIPWRLGKCLVWDATIVDTLAPSHVTQTSQHVGAAATQAEENKRRKYVGNLPREYEFQPLGFETLGAMGPAAGEFVATLGRLLVDVTGCDRAGEYFQQRLSLEILRGNAGSVLGSVEQSGLGVDWLLAGGGGLSA